MKPTNLPYPSTREAQTELIRRALHAEITRRFPDAKAEIVITSASCDFCLDIGIRINGQTFGGRVERRDVNDVAEWVDRTLNDITEYLTPKPKRPLSGANRHLQKCGPQFVRPMIPTQRPTHRQGRRELEHSLDDFERQIRLLAPLPVSGGNETGAQSVSQPRHDPSPAPQGECAGPARP